MIFLIQTLYKINFGFLNKIIFISPSSNIYIDILSRLTSQDFLQIMKLIINYLKYDISYFEIFNILEKYCINKYEKSIPKIIA